MEGSESSVSLLEPIEYDSSTVNLEEQLEEMIEEEAQHPDEEESVEPKLQEFKNQDRKKALLTSKPGPRRKPGWTEVQLIQHLAENRWVMKGVYKGRTLSFEMDGKGPTKLISNEGEPFLTDKVIEQSVLIELAIRMWNGFAPKDFFLNWINQQDTSENGDPKKASDWNKYYDSCIIELFDRGELDTLNREVLYAFARANAVEPIKDGDISLPAFEYHPNVGQKSLMKFVKKWLLIKVSGSEPNYWKDMHVAYKKAEKEELMTQYRKETEGTINLTKLSEWPEQMDEDLQNLLERILRIDQEFPERDPEAEDSMVDDIWADLKEDERTVISLDHSETERFCKKWIRGNLETVQERKIMVVKQQKLLCELILEKKERELLRRETEVEWEMKIERLEMEKTELQRQLAKPTRKLKLKLKKQNRADEDIKKEPMDNKVHQGKSTSDWEEGVDPRPTAGKASDTRTEAQEADLLPRNTEDRIYRKNMITRGIHPNISTDGPRERLRRKPEEIYLDAGSEINLINKRLIKDLQEGVDYSHILTKNRAAKQKAKFQEATTKPGSNKQSILDKLPCKFHKRQGLSAEECRQHEIKHCWECSTEKELAPPLAKCKGPHQWKPKYLKNTEKNISTMTIRPSQVRSVKKQNHPQKKSY